MTKSILFIAFLFISCSSLSDKRYSINSIESSGNKLLTFADNLRINRQYSKALEYYQKSGELYLLKNDKKKYLTVLSRKAIVYLYQNDLVNYEAMVKQIKTFTEIENVSYANELSYLDAKKLETENKTDQAIAVYL